MSSDTQDAGAAPPRAGPLRNGNPRGNPNIAPRCGAKARTQGGAPCRAPAMKNGRCRMHGGKATGPRTAEGLARIIAAVTRHGYYSKEARAARRRAAALKAAARALRAAERAAAVLAAGRVLLVLARAGAHPTEPIAPHRLPLPAAAPPPRIAKTRGITPCTVRTAAP